MSQRFVTFRLEIEAMRHEITAGLIDHEDEIARQLHEAVREYVEGDAITQDIRRAAHEHARAAVKRSVEWAIDDAIRNNPEFRAGVQRALAKRLEEAV